MLTNSSPDTSSGLGGVEPFPHAVHHSPYFRAMRELLRHSIPDFDNSKYELPNVAPDFMETLRQLVLYETEQLTIFHGGRLDLGDVPGKHWLLPAVVHMGEVGLPIQLHAIVSNIDFLSQNIPDASDINFSVSLATETELKLLALKQEEVLLHEALTKGTDQPGIIVRPVTVGNIAYPMIQTPRDLQKAPYIRGAIQKFASFFGIDARDKIPHDIRHLFDEIKREIPEDDWREWGRGLQGERSFQILEPVIVQTSDGNVFVYNIYPKEDVWGMYQLMSWEPLAELVKRPELTMRPDSGCDSGMLYHDKGCDCHRQLLDALAIAKKDGGFVLHFPTQDGRGYGTATKMETELLKQGRRSAMFPTNSTRMDTIEAAKAVFGRAQWDIRNFRYPGLLLLELGFKKVNVYTDSKQKIAEMRQGSSYSVEIERIATNATEKSHGDEDLQRHLAAKHNNEKRYYGDNE